MYISLSRHCISPRAPAASGNHGDIRGTHLAGL